MKNPGPHVLFLTLAALCWLDGYGYAQETLQDPIPQATAQPGKFEAWEYPIVEPALTCEQANRVVLKSVTRLGYKPTTVTPASPGKDGEVKASRPGLWGGEEAVTVTIACTPDGVRVNAVPAVPPCEQGNRIARLVIERLEYKVSEFTPAAIGKPGIVKGTREGQKPLVITLFCSPDQNVVLETSMDSLVPRHKDFYTGISNFYKGFYAVFKGERGMVAPEKIPLSGNQVRVALKPLSGAEMKIAFGVELTKLLPVQIEIANPTTHPYQLEVEQVMLLSTAGKRVKPAVTNEEGIPAPALVNQTIAPGTSVKGYLYYPSGSYMGARGTLTDEDSQEREGFDVQF